jgi:hypothetical protein
VARHQLAELETPPGRPRSRAERDRRLGSVFACHLGLQQQVGSGGAAFGVVQQAREQGGRQTERWVGHDAVGTTRKGNLPQVAAAQLHPVRQPLTLELLLQSSDEPPVAFDREDPHPVSREREGEGAASRSELDDELVVRQVKSRKQSLDDRRVGQQVLSKGAPPSVGRTLSTAVHGTAP